MNTSQLCSEGMHEWCMNRSAEESHCQCRCHKATIPGTRAIAQRIVNAEENFTQIIMEKGFTRAEAQKAMRTMLKLKVAKLDAVGGKINVVHGAYLESDSLRNAVNYVDPRQK